MLDIAKLIRENAALEEQPAGIMQDFTPPNTTSMERIEIDSSSLPYLKSFGMRLDPNVGSANVLYLDPKMRRIDIDLRFNGRSENIVVFGKGTGQKGYVSLEGDRNLAVFGDGQDRRNYINVALRNHDCD